MTEYSENLGRWNFDFSENLTSLKICNFLNSPATSVRIPNCLTILKIFGRRYSELSELSENLNFIFFYFFTRKRLTYFSIDVILYKEVNERNDKENEKTVLHKRGRNTY